MDSRAFIHNIRQATGFHIVMPIIFFILLIIMILQVPILNCIFPAFYSSEQDIAQIYPDNVYVECHADTLYYTGYDYMSGGRIRGHYYYSLVDGRCTIYILSKQLINKMKTGDFPAILHDVTFRAELVTDSKTLKDILTLMAGDMNWSYEGLNSHSSSIIISEPGYSPVSVTLLAVFLVSAFIFTLAHIVSLILGIIFPMRNSLFSSTLKSKKGNNIADVCKEMPSSTEIATDFYLTERYFAYTSPRAMTIVPIDDIDRLYHYNTIHGLPMRRRMSTSMTIVLKSRKKCRYRHIPADDADNIVNELLRRNPDIKIGLSPENPENPEDSGNSENCEGSGNSEDSGNSESSGNSPDSR